MLLLFHWYYSVICHIATSYYIPIESNNTHAPGTASSPKAYSARSSFCGYVVSPYCTSYVKPRAWSYCEALAYTWPTLHPRGVSHKKPTSCCRRPLVEFGFSGCTPKPRE